MKAPKKWPFAVRFLYIPPSSSSSSASGFFAASKVGYAPMLGKCHKAPSWLAYDFPPEVREKLKHQWGSDWKGQAPNNFKQSRIPFPLKCMESLGFVYDFLALSLCFLLKYAEK
ncbi:hypothetical protein NC652_020113 [Populus alba x Populus x berolinensis]|nr:hypothetical protein NC652_020113 [Populus alba x Populus x berolinensis]